MGGRLDRFDLCAILDRMVCAIRCLDVQYFSSLNKLYSLAAGAVYSPQTIKEDFKYERIRMLCEELASIRKETDPDRWELKIKSLEKSLPIPKFELISM